MRVQILVPLDGSDLAEHALPHAEALARAAGARLILARAVDVHSFPGTDPTDAQGRAVLEAEGYLDQIRDDIERRGIPTETATPYGDAAHCVVELASLRGAELIAMATQDRAGFERWIHGSIAEEVVAHSPVPVLLVRAGPQEPPVFEDARLIVPLDGSTAAEAALPVARRLADVLRGSLVLVQAVSASSLLPTPTPFTRALSAGETFMRAEYEAHEHRCGEAESYLDQIAERLAKEGLEVSAEVREGEAVGVITSAAKDYRARIVVMATSARAGIGRAVTGSVAGSVLRDGSIPVVLVRREEGLENAHRMPGGKSRSLEEV